MYAAVAAYKMHMYKYYTTSIHLLGIALLLSVVVNVSLWQKKKKTDKKGTPKPSTQAASLVETRVEMCEIPHCLHNSCADD